MENLLVYGIGFLSQVLFFARTIVQWFKSEHEGKVYSPVLFWKISLIGSLLMLTYGILRNDAAILLGQILVYFIYVRNIHLKGAWTTMFWLLRGVILLAPVAVLAWLFMAGNYSVDTFIKNENVPLFLMIWGIAGQLIFISRFFYQWIYSENRSESVLPKGFWIISTCGSAMIFVYGLYRIDPVLLAAHSFGIFVYIRNIALAGEKSNGGMFSKIKSPWIQRIIQRISEKIN